MKMQVKADPYLRQPLGRLRDFGGDDAGECNCRRVVLEVQKLSGLLMKEKAV